MTELGRATWSALLPWMPSCYSRGHLRWDLHPKRSGRHRGGLLSFRWILRLPRVERHTLWSSIFSSLVSSASSPSSSPQERSSPDISSVSAWLGTGDIHLQLFSQKILVLLAMNAFWLFLGMFIDGNHSDPRCTLILLVTQLGVNLVHLGAIVILNIGLGVITPPFAISIFVGSRFRGAPTRNSSQSCCAFFSSWNSGAAPDHLCPAISCWLPTCSWDRRWSALVSARSGFLPKGRLSPKKRRFRPEWTLPGRNTEALTRG